MKTRLAFAASLLCACSSARTGLSPNPGAAGVGAAGTGGVAGTSGAAGTGAAGAPSSGAGSGGGNPDAGPSGSSGSTGSPGIAGSTGAAGAIDGGVTSAAGTGASPDGSADATFTPFTYTAEPGCSKDGWCWSTPAPQGNPLYAVHGSGPSDVWAVGEAGTTAHFDGKTWTRVESGERLVLRGVWAASPKDAWAVGDDAVVLHWDGKVWARLAGVPSTNFHWRAVWGTSPIDLWVVGIDTSVTNIDSSGGAMIHWDGKAWTTFKGPEGMDALWGTKSDDLWGLGEARELFHWDGKSWEVVSTGEFTQIGTAIWGSHKNDLWLGGRSAGQPSHWDGVKVIAHADSEADINGLWGSGANDVWAVGAGYPDSYGEAGSIHHWNGATWNKVPSAGASILYGIWGSAANDVWAVGQSGDLVHWDGRSWSMQGPPHVNLFSVWASGPDDVWGFGYDSKGLAALRRSGANAAWTRTELVTYAALGVSEGGYAAPYAACGSASDDVWVGGSASEPLGGNGNPNRTFFAHWNGKAWSLDATLPPIIGNVFSINSMWCTSPKDAWAIGTVDSAGGLSGAALHWDGTEWSAVKSLSVANRAHAFRNIWSGGPGDVWIGGEQTVLHWDGIRWTQEAGGQAGDSYIVGGTSPDDVWLLKSSSDETTRITRKQGAMSSFISVPISITPTLLTVISATDAWILSDQTLIHWDGKTWTPSDAGTTFMYGNLRWDGKALWSVANRGLIRH